MAYGRQWLRKQTWTRPNTSHVVLGLIFPPNTSQTAFEEHRVKLLAGRWRLEGPTGNPDEYKAENVFLGAGRGPLSQLQAHAQTAPRSSARGRRHGGESSATPTASRGCCRRITPELALEQAKRLGGTDRCDRHDSNSPPPPKARASLRKSHRSRGSCWASGVTKYFLTPLCLSRVARTAAPVLQRPVVCALGPGGDAGALQGPHLRPCCGSAGMFVQSEEVRGKPRRRLAKHFPI